MAEIIQLTSADERALSEVNVLLKQLSERIPPCTLELLKDIVEDKNLELWVALENEKIVGMGELVIVLKPDGTIAQIEDVVVDEGQRGKGLGKAISEKLIERAQERGARAIHLSSNPLRVAANELYKKIGFELHGTNSYRMKL